MSEIEERVREVGQHMLDDALGRGVEPEIVAAAAAQVAGEMGAMIAIGTGENVAAIAAELSKALVARAYARWRAERGAGLVGHCWARGCRHPPDKGLEPQRGGGERRPTPALP